MTTRGRSAIATKCLLCLSALLIAVESSTTAAAFFCRTTRTTTTTTRTTKIGSISSTIIPSSRTSNLFATKKKKSGQRPAANHEKWQPKYESLVAFHNQHGHCNVSSSENPGLSEWLSEQISSYQLLKLGRKTKLTKKRAAALERIGAIPPELL